MVYHRWSCIHGSDGSSTLLWFTRIHCPRHDVHHRDDRIHRWQRHLLLIHALYGRKALPGSCLLVGILIRIHGWLNSTHLPSVRLDGAIQLGYQLQTGRDLRHLLVVVVGLWHADVQMDSRARNPLSHGMGRVRQSSQGRLRSGVSDRTRDQEIQGSCTVPGRLSSVL